MADFKESYRVVLLGIAYGIGGHLANQALKDPLLELSIKLVFILLVLAVFRYVVNRVFEERPSTVCTRLEQR